ncbi:MAG: hypothetical protein WD314_15950 [Trueperaceae bacterium]
MFKRVLKTSYGLAEVVIDRSRLRVDDPERGMTVTPMVETEEIPVLNSVFREEAVNYLLGLDTRPNSQTSLSYPLAMRAVRLKIEYINSVMREEQQELVPVAGKE